MPKPRPTNNKAASPRNPKQAAFLAAFAQCGTVTRAAEAAGINRHTHSRWLKDDAKYAEAFTEAAEEAADNLETEARRRARDGVMRMKFHQGMPIIDPRTVGPNSPMYDPEFPAGKPYMEHEYSDTLLIFLLKGARPAKFRDNSTVIHQGEVKFGQITLDGGKEAAEG